MYVCLCETFTNVTVANAINDGARTVEDIGLRCGAGIVCGRCGKTIEKLLTGQQTDASARFGPRKEPSWRRG